jgi:hypothetical protein
VIPLILLALGLGVALTAYELSPRTRVRVDDYARAIRSAHDAHQAADAHLNNAHATVVTAVQHAQQADSARQPAPMPPPPSVPTVPPPMAAPSPPPVQDVGEAHANASKAAIDAAVEHVVVAIDANKEAARKTAEAAQNAKAEAERAAVAQSAAKVLEREKKLAAALASLGIGQCGARSYARVTEQIKDKLLAKLSAEGMAVTGENPWNIDTKQTGVKLRAFWDSKTSSLKLIVTSTGLGWCSIIWDRIEPKLKEVIGP